MTLNGERGAAYQSALEERETEEWRRVISASQISYCTNALMGQELERKSERIN